jgi:hypothetical protein
MILALTYLYQHFPLFRLVPRSLFWVLAVTGSLYAVLAARAGSYTPCGDNGYIAGSGHCVELPDDNPVGATARCADGTYSHSEHPEYSGTCSDQGGVVDDDLSEHDEHLNDD